MRGVVAFVFLVACGDSYRIPDATKIPDAAIDAPIDAPDAGYTCLSSSDCTTGSFCCFACSPGGACSPDSFCAVGGSPGCAHTLCDPLVAGPCMTAFGATGTCQETELSLSDHRKVWACR